LAANRSAPERRLMQLSQRRGLGQSQAGTLSGPDLFGRDFGQLGFAGFPHQARNLIVGRPSAVNLDKLVDRRIAFRAPPRVLLEGRQQASPNNTTDGLPVAMLNLDSETSVRSNRDERHTTELQRLPRKRLDLTVNLPRGLEAGAYELAFSREDPPLLTLTGQAIIEDGLTVLRLQADLSALAPGQYQLRIHREGSSWRESQVLLF